MIEWSLIRFVHLVAMTFFLGGQLALLVAVTPALRRHGTDEAMRMAARRYGIGSAIALVLLIATGLAMTSHYVRWESSILQTKLAVFAGLFLLLGAHVVRPKSRPLAYALPAATLVIVWLGVRLAHG